MHTEKIQRQSLNRTYDTFRNKKEIEKEKLQYHYTTILTTSRKKHLHLFYY